MFFFIWCFCCWSLLLFVCLFVLPFVFQSHILRDIPIVTWSLTSLVLVSSPSSSCPGCIWSGAPWWQCQHPHSSSPVTLLMVYCNVTRSAHTCHFLARSPLLPSFLFWWYIELPVGWSLGDEGRYHNQALGCLPKLSITMQWLVFSSCDMMTLLLFISYCELCIKDVSWSILHDYSLVALW